MVASFAHLEIADVPRAERKSHARVVVDPTAVQQAAGPKLRYEPVQIAEPEEQIELPTLDLSDDLVHWSWPKKLAATYCNSL